MQTFLPYASFIRSARVLDMKRLGKQRVETLQVMNVFGGARAGWGNHPITNMWRGYECALMRYQVRICEEWVHRGYRDTCLLKTKAIHEACCAGHCVSGHTKLSKFAPWWLGDPRLHRSHQGNLVRKAPELYGELFPAADPEAEYWWPVPKRQP